jgi:uncharacterized protein (UPF0212 family)
MMPTGIPARGLSAFELLTAWEQGLGQPPAEQALTLLIAAYPEIPPDELAQLSIGQRDACLLTLREWTFGPRLVGIAACPACAERLELSFDVADIRTDPVTDLFASNDKGIETHTVSAAGYDVTFRLPNSLDLEAARTDNLDATRQRLLERCVLAAYQSGEQRPVDDAPAEAMTAVMERMEQLDPQANVQLALSCPSCGHEWQALFDIVPFFWNEINGWAYRLLREVHTLASAYGWREADILAMSPWRRQVYLSMAGG